jgi:peptide chain release factor 2
VKRLAELDARAGEPSFWNDSNSARTVIEEANKHRAVVRPFSDMVKALEDATVLTELAEAEPEGPTRDASLREVGELLSTCSARFETLEMTSLLNGRFDSHNAYLTLHAGAGGTESCDWAEMLLRMYRHYCEDHGFQLEIEDVQPGEEAGIRSVTFAVMGPYAYGTMSTERGVHRLVRISPFDANKRRHTSFVALDVVAEVDDVEVDLNEDDLRVDTYRSSGSGGQHVNRTDSAIRLTHRPSGIVVSCQAERSQHKNRAKAMSMLRARLYEWMEDQKRRDLERFYGQKGEIAWGSQIRSYVLQPYTLAKDHRTGVETSNIRAVLDGEIQMFIDAYLKKRAQDAAAAGAAAGGKK